MLNELTSWCVWNVCVSIVMLMLLGLIFWLDSRKK